MANFDNFWGLNYVLKFHIFIFQRVKNRYVFVLSAKNWFDFSQMGRSGTRESSETIFKVDVNSS